jgi:hypothetical protein
VVVSVAAASAAIVIGDTRAVRATTMPGVLSVSKLVITDHAMMVRIRRHKWASVVHYPRGAEVRYDVSNRGTRPYSLNILGSVTGRLAPGRRAPILVYWGRRGTFVFRALPDGPKITVVIA